MMCDKHDWIVPPINPCPACAIEGRIEKLEKDTARLVELEKDKARLDWLEQRDTVKAFNRPGVVPLWYCGVDGDIRAAIDAAKGGE